MPTKINLIQAREILDSRGEPTVEVRVDLVGGASGTAAVPSGASTGTHEAWELRDGDERRYHGKGVLQAVRNVNQVIAPALKKAEASRQSDIDETMITLDSTPNKRRLGANAILGVSLAVARAVAQAEKLPLYQYLRELSPIATDRDFPMPMPIMNIFNGGKHADTNLDFQEFWIVPHAATTAAENLRAGSEIFHELKQVLWEQNLDTDIGNEGGFAPDIHSSVDALDWIMEAIKRAHYKPGDDVWLGLDAGANTFYDAVKNRYYLEVDHAAFTAKELLDLYGRWLDLYPIALLEDGLREDDWDGWKQMTERFRQRLTIIGDDLFVTNVERLQTGISRGVANAVLVKPNQVGTLTETLACIRLAKEHGYRVVLSHRSGETTDTTIADLAVAVKADYLKAGSVTRGERVAKYNRLMEIETEISQR